MIGEQKRGGSKWETTISTCVLVKGNASHGPVVHHLTIYPFIYSSQKSKMTLDTSFFFIHVLSNSSHHQLSDVTS